MKLSKHQRHRRKLKAKAIALKGGQCERCGFADDRALRFHHRVPVRRGRNGLSHKAMSSTESHRAVVGGDVKPILLLCANCSVIASAKDVAANANIKRR